jgi:type IV pilus assembly protein PilM
MVQRLWGRTTPIGLDCDGRFLTAVQLTGGGRPRLTNAVRIERTSAPGLPSGEEAARLRRILERRGFRGRQVVLGLDEGLLMTAVLDLPPRSSGAPLAEIAAGELTRMNGCTPHTAEAAFWELPGSGHGGEALQAVAVGCRHEVAETSLAPYEEAGLVPVALDCDLHAAVRACRPVVAKDRMVALLDLGWDRALLAILRGRDMLYRKALPDAAMRLLWDSVGRRLGLGQGAVDCLLAPAGPGGTEPADAALEAVEAAVQRHAQALAETLEAPFAYAASQRAGSPVAEVLLTGPGAAVPGIAGALASPLAVEVRQVRPSEVVVAARGDLQEAAANAALITAIGLASFREEASR